MDNASTLNQLQAPGCFGAASVYTIDSDVCKQCQAYAGCGEESLKVLSSIRERVSVEDLLKKHKAIKLRTVSQSVSAPVDSRPEALKAQPVVKNVERKTTTIKVDFEISEGDMMMIGKLPAKAQPVAIRIIKSGAAEQIRAGLAVGKNACPEKMATFLKEAINLMIAEGGFTKRRLVEHFIERQVLSPESQVSPAIAIIIGCQFGTINAAGQIVVNPKLAAQNSANQ